MTELTLLTENVLVISEAFVALRRNIGSPNPNFQVRVVVEVPVGEKWCTIRKEVFS